MFATLMGCLRALLRAFWRVPRAPLGAPWLLWSAQFSRSRLCLEIVFVCGVWGRCLSAPQAAWRTPGAFLGAPWSLHLPFFFKVVALETGLRACGRSSGPLGGLFSCLWGAFGRFGRRNFPKADWSLKAFLFAALGGAARARLPGSSAARRGALDALVGALFKEQFVFRKRVCFIFLVYPFVRGQVTTPWAM